TLGSGYFHFETARSKSLSKGRIGRYGERCAATRAYQWFQPEDGKSCGGDSAKLFRLQLHQDSSYTSHVPSYGGWPSRIGCGA
ncbi:MAG: hypothetical protein WA510_04580, partial [Acidobacteriaceae bacterium]